MLWDIASTRDVNFCYLLVGPHSALNLSEENATAVSSGSVSSRPPSLAIDGTSSSCSSVSGTSKAWLRVDIQPVRFIREVRLLFRGGSGVSATIRVGRSLQKNGALNNEKCSGISNSTVSSYWKNDTCSQPILGQFIYIESPNNSMQICEIEVFYGMSFHHTVPLLGFLINFCLVVFTDKILNIYSPVYVTASDQKEGFGSIWKPIDGVVGPNVEESWISLQSSQSWWRMELPRRIAVSSVVIHIPVLKLETFVMAGFAVYIGDVSYGNGSKNEMCGKPWTVVYTTVIKFDCQQAPAGKYLYVAASDKKESALYLTEINVYGCDSSCTYGKLRC